MSMGNTPPVTLGPVTVTRHSSNSVTISIKRQPDLTERYKQLEAQSGYSSRSSRHLINDFAKRVQEVYRNNAAPTMRADIVSLCSTFKEPFKIALINNCAELLKSRVPEQKDHATSFLLNLSRYDDYLTTMAKNADVPKVLLSQATFPNEPYKIDTLLILRKLSQQDAASDFFKEPTTVEALILRLNTSDIDNEQRLIRDCLFECSKLNRPQIQKEAVRGVIETFSFFLHSPLPMRAQKLLAMQQLMSVLPLDAISNDLVRSDVFPALVDCLETGQGAEHDMAKKCILNTPRQSFDKIPDATLNRIIALLDANNPNLEDIGSYVLTLITSRIATNSRKLNRHKVLLKRLAALSTSKNPVFVMRATVCIAYLRVGRDDVRPSIPFINKCFSEEDNELKAEFLYHLQPLGDFKGASMELGINEEFSNHIGKILLTSQDEAVLIQALTLFLKLCETKDNLIFYNLKSEHRMALLDTSLNTVKRSPLTLLVLDTIDFSLKYFGYVLPQDEEQQLAFTLVTHLNQVDQTSKEKIKALLANILRNPKVRPTLADTDYKKAAIKAIIDETNHLNRKMFVSRLQLLAKLCSSPETADLAVQNLARLKSKFGDALFSGSEESKRAIKELFKPLYDNSRYNDFVKQQFPKVFKEFAKAQAVSS